MTVARTAHRAWTVVRMRPRRQALVAEAAFALLVARVMLGTASFARVAERVGGTFVPPEDLRIAQARTAPSESARRTARQVQWALSLVAPRLPFRAVCLQQAFAARRMLARRGVASVIHFGIGRGAFEQGHAWLEAAGVPVTGYPLDPAVVELGCMV